MTEKKRKHSKQFKVDAVKLVTEQGYKASEAARNLGTHENLLGRWKRQFEMEKEARLPRQGPYDAGKRRVAPAARREQATADGARNIKKSRGLLCERVEIRFDFIRQQEKACPIALMCRVPEVSRSGYYKYLKTCQETKIDPDFELVVRVREIHTESGGTYGSRRMSKRLRKDGRDVGRTRARSLMKKAGVSAKRRKRFKRTTDSRHALPVAPNLLSRAFSVKQPNRVWCVDISYLWTMEGWLYLAVVLDLYSRKVVGWAMERRIDSALVEQALSMAYFRRKPPKGLMHHSDRGSQYAGERYQSLLRRYGMICSMSRKGDCWDNAVVESFFHSLKTERTDDVLYRTREEAGLDVMDYIEMFYNSRRLHSFIGYRSPTVLCSPGFI